MASTAKNAQQLARRLFQLSVVDGAVSPERVSGVLAYVEKHRPDVAAKVVADVRVDLDHLDEEQVLRFAQYYFAGPPERDAGDGRWGASPAGADAGH